MTTPTASVSNRHTPTGVTVLFAGLGLVTVTIATLFSPGQTAHHLILLLLLLPFLGIPHGALDYALAQRLFRRRWGRAWGPVFVALYLLAMGLVLIVWHYLPTFSLAAFLALTWYHFSTGDALTVPRTPLPLRVTEGLARGGLILCFPAVFDRTEVQQLLAYLAPEAGVGLLLDILGAIAPLCALAAAGSFAASLTMFIGQRAAIDLARAVEFAILALLFMLLPALLAFTIYFNFLHAVRHMLTVGVSRQVPSAFRVWTHMLCLSLPVTLATLLLGACAYSVMGGVSFDTSRLMRVIFIGIASMTYPHVIVVSLASLAGQDPKAPSARCAALVSGGNPSPREAGL